MTALTKQQLLAAVLGALGGTKLTPKATPQATPTSPKRLGETENAITRRWATHPPMRPRAKLWYIHHHTCRACGTKSKFVGQPLVRYANETTGYARELPTASVDKLPVEIIDLPELTTEQCPTCLCLSRRLDDILAAHAIGGTGLTQQELFS